MDLNKKNNYGYNPNVMTTTAWRDIPLKVQNPHELEIYTFFIM